MDTVENALEKTVIFGLTADDLIGRAIMLAVAVLLAVVVAHFLTKLLRRLLDVSEVPSASIFVNIARALVWAFALLAGVVAAATGRWASPPGSSSLLPTTSTRRQDDQEVLKLGVLLRGPGLCREGRRRPHARYVGSSDVSVHGRHARGGHVSGVSGRTGRSRPALGVRDDFVLRARHTRMRHMSEADEAQAGPCRGSGPACVLVR